jgi:hypothetical protein
MIAVAATLSNLSVVQADNPQTLTLKNGKKITAYHVKGNVFEVPDYEVLSPAEQKMLETAVEGCILIKTHREDNQFLLVCARRALSRPLV